MPAIVPEGGWISGVQLPIQTLTRALADPWEADASVTDLVRVARTAEATGHAFVGVCDHVAIPDDDYCAQMTTTWYDTIATLGFLAAHTESIRLMSTVWIAAYRHPLQTASSFGTLDHLSGGRVILGIGAGHVEGEFRALGVPFQERGAILDETLEALEGVYRDRYVSFSGSRISLRLRRRRSTTGRPSAHDVDRWQLTGGVPAGGPVRRRLYPDGYATGGLPAHLGHDQAQRRGQRAARRTIRYRLDARFRAFDRRLAGWDVPRQFPGARAVGRPTARGTRDGHQRFPHPIPRAQPGRLPRAVRRVRRAGRAVH